MHVYRLKPYTPYYDGMPSVSNAEPRRQQWSAPSGMPKVGEFVVLKVPKGDWQRRPFAVAKVLRLIPSDRKNGAEALVAQWYGSSTATSVAGPYRPGYLDPRDNKLIFGPTEAAMIKRSKEYTNLLMRPQRKLHLQDILMVEPEWTTARKLSAKTLRQLALCPDIDWADEENLEFPEEKVELVE